MNEISGRNLKFFIKKGLITKYLAIFMNAFSELREKFRRKMLVLLTALEKQKHDFSHVNQYFLMIISIISY